MFFRVAHEKPFFRYPLFHKQMPHSIPLSLSDGHAAPAHKTPTVSFPERPQPCAYLLSQTSLSLQRFLRKSDPAFSPPTSTLLISSNSIYFSFPSTSTSYMENPKSATSPSSSSHFSKKLRPPARALHTFRLLFDLHLLLQVPTDF